MCAAGGPVRAPGVTRQAGTAMRRAAERAAETEAGMARSSASGLALSPATSLRGAGLEARTPGGGPADATGVRADGAAGAARTAGGSVAVGRASAGRRRVLLVVNNFPPVRGGSAVVYDAVARHAGGQVMVLTARRSYADGLPLIGWREHDRRAPYPVIRLDLLRTQLRGAARPGPLGRLALGIADLAIRARVLAVVLWLVLTARVRAVCIGELISAGWLLTALRLVPFLRRVIYMHGEELTTDDGYDEGFHRRRRCVAAAQRIVAVSRHTRAATLGLLGAAPGGAADRRIVLIENGVDPVRFCPGPKRPDLLACYGIEGAFVFVSVCRLLEKKGIDQAIRAFAAVAAAFPDCRYLVVGDGPDRARLAAIAAEEGVAGRVVFAGPVAEEDLVDHYRLGDVFVMPNRELANGDTEGFGLVFLEANACGLPVVAGGAGGSVDAVTDGVNGLVVDGRDVGAVAGAMRRLREDGRVRAELAAGGLAVARGADWGGKATGFVGACLGDGYVTPIGGLLCHTEYPPRI